MFAARRKRFAAATAGVALLSLLGAPNASALEAPSDQWAQLHSSDADMSASDGSSLVRYSLPPDDWAPGIAPKDLATKAMEQMRANTSGGSEQSALWGCNPDTYSDNPHKSKNGTDVSGHGWWGKGTCDNNRAWVTTRLYEWYNSSSGGGAFFFKKESRNDVGAKGKSGYARVNARLRCSSTKRTTWMNAVDVDVISEVDNSERSMKKADVYCRVP